MRGEERRGTGGDGDEEGRRMHRHFAVEFLLFARLRSRKGRPVRYLGTSSALMLSMFGCPSADVASGVTLHPHGSPALSLTAAASGVRLQGAGKGQGGKTARLRRSAETT